MFQPHVFLHLVRSLFPRWSFFDRTSHDIDFEVKTRASDNWKRVTFKVERSAFGLFINPEVNLALAQQSLIQQFLNDLLEQPEKIEEQSSYKMILSLAQRHAGVPEFQFKIAARQSGKTLAMYASTWLHAKGAQ